jgi:hypothetical protein
MKSSRLWELFILKNLVYSSIRSSSSLLSLFRHACIADTPDCSGLPAAALGFGFLLSGGLLFVPQPVHTSLSVAVPYAWTYLVYNDSVF